MLVLYSEWEQGYLRSLSFTNVVDQSWTVSGRWFSNKFELSATVRCKAASVLLQKVVLLAERLWRLYLSASVTSWSRQVIGFSLTTLSYNMTCREQLFPSGVECVKMCAVIPKFKLLFYSMTAKRPALWLVLTTSFKASSNPKHTWICRFGSECEQLHCMSVWMCIWMFGQIGSVSMHLTSGSIVLLFSDMLIQNDNGSMLIFSRG